jgi:hypothetical protein
MAYSRPYIASGDEHLFEEVQAIAAEQERMARRLADVILSGRERLPRATFPMSFASLHDLELRHLIKLAVDEQRTRVAEIEVAVEELSHDAKLEKLAREILTREAAHSALLRELSRSPAKLLTRPTEAATTRRERQARSVQSITTAA